MQSTGPQKAGSLGRCVSSHRGELLLDLGADGKDSGEAGAGVGCL